MPTIWTHRPGTRLRPVPEMACCLAYARNPPRLLGLNLTSWLVYTLCDGRDEPTISRDYAEALSGARDAGNSTDGLASALTQLETLGLIEKTIREELR